MQKSKRKAIGGLIFGIGLIALLIGAMTDLYDTKTGVLVMLGVWFIGGALAALIIGGNEETPKPPEQS
ncbi:MAG: hypothetical protein KAS78_03225 [Candidatus Pacebacteria bacterium]|nr:hypothetical protein [Candidatus Paceibacterota bacterium]